MKKNKIQAILPDALIDKFDAEAKKQGRSHSNLARLYIVRGLQEDDDGIVANVSGKDLQFILNRNK